jgi:hypothetical protein
MVSSLEPFYNLKRQALRNSLRMKRGSFVGCWTRRLRQKMRRLARTERAGATHSSLMLGF